MKAQKLRELSYFIISEYYKNNLEPFFKYLDDDVVWYGPAEGQVIVTKQKMLEAWQNEKHNLKFSMKDTKERIVKINNNATSVILSYYVYTYYPNGAKHVHNQNIDLTWIERKIKDKSGNVIKKPLIIKMFIANIHPKHKNDKIYAVHGEEENFNQPALKPSAKITVRDKTGSVYYLSLDHIIYVEKIDEGRHSLIYTLTEKIESLETTASIQKQSDNFFLSPHISYLVNPSQVKSLKRFKLTLENGRILPIAEKKYTKFKERLESKNV